MLIAVIVLAVMTGVSLILLVFLLLSVQALSEQVYQMARGLEAIDHELHSPPNIP